MNRSNSNQGFSTLEILIALALLILCLTAVVTLFFGGQTILVDSQTSREALSRAQGLLEKAQADARKDFKLVNPTSSQEDIYQKKVKISQPDYFTKLVTAEVSWIGENNRNLNVLLSGLVTNFDNAIGGDTCYSWLSPSADAWKSPQIKNAVTSFTSLTGISGAYPITDVDAYDNRLYITIGSTPGATDPTFFIFNITSPTGPVLLNSPALDNAPSTASGLNAVATNGKYAFVANGYGANFSTCVNSDGYNTACGQLQIIDINNPALPQIKYTLKLPGVGGTQGVGNSIFYKDGYIYLGLKSTGCSGPEFHIIDVHNPALPIEAGYWPKIGNLGNDINAVYVKGKYAYLATPDSQELIVLDISDPADIKTGSPNWWGYDALGGGNGKSLHFTGDNLYLGRTVPSAGPVFYVLDVSEPENILIKNPNPPTHNIGLSIDSVSVRAGLDAASPPVMHNLVFFLTTTDFEVWDLTTPTSISQWSSIFLSLPAGGSGVYEPVMDCEGNYFFVGSNNASNQSFLSVITAP